MKDTSFASKLREIMEIKPGFSTQRFEAVLQLYGEERQRERDELLEKILDKGVELSYATKKGNSVPWLHGLREWLLSERANTNNPTNN